MANEWLAILTQSYRNLRQSRLLEPSGLLTAVLALLLGTFVAYISYVLGSSTPQEYQTFSLQLMIAASLIIGLVGGLAQVSPAQVTYQLSLSSSVEVWRKLMGTIGTVKFLQFTIGLPFHYGLMKSASNVGNDSLIAALIFWFLIGAAATLTGIAIALIIRVLTTSYLLRSILLIAAGSILALLILSADRQFSLLLIDGSSMNHTWLRVLLSVGLLGFSFSLIEILAHKLPRKLHPPLTAINLGRSSLPQNHKKETRNTSLLAYDGLLLLRDVQIHRRIILILGLLMSLAVTAQLSSNTLGLSLERLLLASLSVSVAAISTFISYRAGTRVNQKLKAYQHLPISQEKIVTSSYFSSLMLVLLLVVLFMYLTPYQTQQLWSWLTPYLLVMTTVHTVCYYLGLRRFDPSHPNHPSILLTFFIALVIAITPVFSYNVLTPITAATLIAIWLAALLIAVMHSRYQLRST